MGQLPSIVNIMNKTHLGIILSLYLCLLTGLSQSARTARMDASWKSKRALGRDGGQQKFPSPEIIETKRSNARDGGHQKFPSPEIIENVPNPCLQRDGGHQKFPCPEKRGVGNFPDIFRPLPENQQNGGTDEGSDGNDLVVSVKRQSQHHRMSKDFQKKSAEVGNFPEHFRPLPENTDSGVIEVKRQMEFNRMSKEFQKKSAEVGNFPEHFRPLPENTDSGVIEVKRNLNPHNRMAPGFQKKSAEVGNFPEHFRPLPENTDSGVIEVKRKLNPHNRMAPGFQKKSAEVGNFPEHFRPLPANTGSAVISRPVISVKRQMNPNNRMASMNHLNRMAKLPDKRNYDEVDKCATNSPIVDIHDESLLEDCCRRWYPNTERSGRVKDILVFRACREYL